MIVKKEKISEELIQKIHKKLTKNTYDERRCVVNKERPGQYKIHEHITGINKVGSAAENVQEDMKQLVQEINEGYLNSDEEILKVAAYLHNMIEQIHPFVDGNGRLGRTLLNYFLMINNLSPIIIYIEDKVIIMKY